MTKKEKAITLTSDQIDLLFDLCMEEVIRLKELAYHRFMDKEKIVKQMNTISELVHIFSNNK